VKLKSLGHLLGFRPPPEVYGSKILAFELPRDGRVEYAQWLHPAETTKVITQGAVDELRTFLGPGDVAIDIGAHTGDTSVPMALATGVNGAVLALEPNPYVFAVLQRNAALNRDKTNIHPLNFAAMPASGLVEFEYSDAGYCNGGRHEGISKWRHGHAFTLEVRGQNLHDYMHRHVAELIPRVRYVKIDAEGYDLHVLRSIEELLLETRPFVRAEIFGLASPADRLSIVEYLRSLGYHVHRVADETCYRGAVVDAAALQGAEHFDVFAVPDPARVAGARER
jgi:FkbM family methyltransferase